MEVSVVVNDIMRLIAEDVRAYLERSECCMANPV